MRVKLKYELIVSPQITLETLAFADRDIEFENDLDPYNPFRFVKEDSSYYVYPTQSSLKIYVLASGSTGFSWQLNIWINDKKITTQPIKTNANSNSRADYNAKINWNI